MTVAPGYEQVAEAVVALVDDDGSTGAAFTAIVDGEVVLDVHAGDAAPGTPWTERTIVPVFSCTKAWLGLALLMLADRGQLDLDDPVRRWWPELGSGANADLTVGDLASHRAGLPGIWRELAPLDILDDLAMEAELASQEPSADPRARACYHALTIGWLVGGLVRRVDGRGVGAFLADEVMGPLGADAWLGLPAGLDDRVARLALRPGAGVWPPPGIAEPMDPLHAAIWGNPPLFAEVDGELLWNQPRAHRAGVPGAGGVASARGMARVAACLASGGTLDGVRLVGEPTLARGVDERSRFHDPFVDETMVAATCMRLQEPSAVLGPEPDAFGHPGAGGSIAGSWPRLRTGFAFATNDLHPGVSGARTTGVLGLLHAAVTRGRP